MKGKKLLLTALCLTSVTACALGFAACGDDTPADHTHTAGSWVNTDPDGHYKLCTDENCPDSTEKLESAAHSWGSGRVTKEATCTAEGEKTFTCAVCGATKTETVAKTEHEWDMGTVTVEATCQTNGVTTYTCTVEGCGETKQVTGEKGKHNLVWSHNASAHWQECDVEGCTHKTEEIDHTWDEGKVTTEPTETETGVKTYTCTEKSCGATKTETVPVLGHSHTPAETWVNTDADEHWKECTDDTCHEKLDKEAHKWDEGEVTTDPTCIALGEKTYTCTVCKATKTEAVNKTAHTYAEGWSFNETYHYHACVTEGCDSVSGSELHVWSSGVLSKSPTAWEAGERSYSCAESGCGATKTEAIDIVPEVKELGASITTDKAYIQYRFNLTLATFDQLIELTLESGATVEYHVYAFKDSGDTTIVEKDSGKLTASGLVDAPAGTIRVMIEVTSEAGTTLKTELKQAVGGNENPDPLALGTAKSREFADRGDYWYALTLAEGKKVTVVSAETESVTVTLYAADGETELATVANGLCVADFAAGSYLVKVSYLGTDDPVSVSVLARDYAEESDLGKAAGAPKAIAAETPVTAADGASYFSYSTQKAGTLKANGGTVSYYADAGYKTAIAPAEGGVSLGENATVYVFIAFGEAESVTFTFTEIVKEFNFSVTFTQGGEPFKNAAVSVTNSTGDAVGDELVTDDAGKASFTALAGVYTVSLKGYEYNSPYRATSVTVSATEEDDGEITGALELVGRESFTVTLPIAAENVEIVLFDGTEITEESTRGRGRTNEQGVAVVYYDYNRSFDNGANCYIALNYNEEEYVFTATVNGIYNLNCQSTKFPSSSGDKAVTVTEFYKLLKYELTLVGEDGNPLGEGITVTLKDGAKSYTATTNAQGVAIFTDAVPAKEYAISLSGSYSTENTTSATEKASTVTCASFSITVGGGSKAPVDITVDQNGVARVQRTDASHAYFKFTPEVKGKYIVTIDGSYFFNVKLNGAAAGDRIIIDGVTDGGKESDIKVLQEKDGKCTSFSVTISDYISFGPTDEGTYTVTITMAGGTTDSPTEVKTGASVLAKDGADNAYFKFTAATDGKYTFTVKDDTTYFKDVTLDGKNIITFKSSKHTVDSSVEKLSEIASGRNMLVSSFAVEMSAGETLVFDFNNLSCIVEVALVTE